MFIGHFAVGFAAKKFAPRSSLAILLAAPLLSDLLWPLFLLLGWETVRIDPRGMKLAPLDFVNYPWSHSLLMCAVWGLLMAALYYAVTRYRAGALAVLLGVMSHWLLDWITHGPDMPLYPGGPKFGLGLWNSIPGTITVELVLFGVGIWMYSAATRTRDRIGRYAYLAFVLVLLASYLNGSLSSDIPRSVNKEIAWPGLVAGTIMLLWAWWFDRHRRPMDAVSA